MHATKYLFIFNALCMTAMMAFVPVIGPIVREVGLADWQAGLVVSASGVFWLLSARTWGKASDRHGRKRILLLAGVGYVLAYLCLALWLDFSLSNPVAPLLVLAGMIAARGSIGLFYAAIAPVSAAYVADTTPVQKRQQSMAALGAANAIGLVVGPSVGGYLAAYHLILPLYLVAALPVIGWLLLAAKLPKSPQLAPAKDQQLSILDPRIRLPMLAMFVAMFAVITAQMILSFYLIDLLNLSTTRAAAFAGLGMALVGITLIVVQGIMVKRAPKSSTLSLKIGSVVAALGLLLVVLMPMVWATPLAVISGYVVLAAGVSFIFPAVQAAAANSVAANEQGLAAGTISAVQGCASIIVPLLTTFIYQMQPASPYLLSALMMLGLFFYSLTYRSLPMDGSVSSQG